MASTLLPAAVLSKSPDLGTFLNAALQTGMRWHVFYFLVHNSSSNDLNYFGINHAHMKQREVRGGRGLQADTAARGGVGARGGGWVGRNQCREGTCWNQNGLCSCLIKR